MRLEKGYRSWGADLTTERTPLENGLPHLVNVGERQFIGRDALLKRQDSSERWEMCLLETEAVERSAQSPIDPFYGHSLYYGDKIVGVVSSAAYGHRVNKHLALAWLSDPLLCESYRNGKDISLNMDVAGFRINCAILDRVPFDARNGRMRNRQSIPVADREN